MKFELKHIKDRFCYQNILYCILVFFILGCVLSGYTTIPRVFPFAGKLYLLTQCATYALLTLYIVLFSNYSINAIKKLLCIVFIVALSILTGGDYAVLGILLFVLASEKADDQAVAKLYLYTHSLILFLIVSLSLSGMIDPNIVPREGVDRIALGFHHPNMAGTEVLIIILAILYLKWEKLKLKHLLIIVFLLCFVFYFTMCRTMVIVAAFALLLYFFFRILNLSIKKMYYFSLFLFIFLIAFSLYFFFFFDSSDPISHSLDGLLSYRLLFGHQAFSTFGLSLLGRNIRPYIVDNSYLYLLVRNGILFEVVFLLFVYACLRIFYKTNSKNGLCLMTCMVVFGYMETYFYGMEWNFLFLIAGSLLINSSNMSSPENSQAARIVGGVL